MQLHGFILLLCLFGYNHTAQYKDRFENYSVIFFEFLVQETTKLQNEKTYFDITQQCLVGSNRNRGTDGSDGDFREPKGTGTVLFAIT